MKDDDTLAFPNALPDGDYVEGMTLRDYFAAKALTALIAAADTHPSVTRDDIVAEAYHYADAMLKKRVK